MKKLIKKSLVLVVVFATMVSYANEFPLLTKEKTKKVTHVSFKNVEQGSLLTIKDNHGLILFKELIEKTGKYSRGFDLTALPNGSYYFELDKDVQIIIRPFKVVENVVTFNKEHESVIFKPVIHVKKDKVYISKLSFEDEVLELEIISDSYDLVLSEKIMNINGSLGKIYDFSTSRKGTYTIITKTAGRRFVNNIKI